MIHAADNVVMVIQRTCPSYSRSWNLDITEAVIVGWSLISQMNRKIDLVFNMRRLLTHNHHATPCFFDVFERYFKVSFTKHPVTLERWQAIQLIGVNKHACWQFVDKVEEAIRLWLW